MKPRRIAGIGCVLFLAASPSGAAPDAAADSSAACVDVQIGSDRTAFLNCMNDAFQRRVERERAAPREEAPVSTGSPANQLGIAGESAGRQRMGNTFGVSPVPQRPERVFVNPLPAPSPH
jgi:hypothetical protein